MPSTVGGYFPVPGLAARRHVHDQHRDVVVLVVTCEHMIHQVLEQPFRVAKHVFIDSCGHRRQLVKTRVQTTIPVLYQPVGIENRCAAWPQAERVLFPRDGPAERGSGFHPVEPWRHARLEHQRR